MDLGDDLEDLFLQITKWAVLTNTQPTDDHHLKDLNRNIEGQEWITDDYVSDLMYMRQTTDGVKLSVEGDEHCRTLAKVALLLQLSHVSYSTIAEVLVGLQTTETLAARVSKRLKREITKTRQIISDIQGLERRVTTDSIAKLNDDVVKRPIVESGLNITAEDSATRRVIAKYSKAARAHRQVLDAAGAFSICPSESLTGTFSQNSIDELPLSSLLALSSSVDQENEVIKAMHQELSAAYGENCLSLAPDDVAAAEEEIRKLRNDCDILEEQYRKSLG